MTQTGDLNEQNCVPDLLNQGLSDHLPSTLRTRLRLARIGIAGAGGLGSNVAQHLTRSGIGTLVVVDFDIVCATNLNRQFYFPDQVGQPKVVALKENLTRICPSLCYEDHCLRLDRNNTFLLFQGCDLVVEALDEAVAKAHLVDSLLAQGVMVIAASGIGGYGAPENFSVRSLGKNLFIVGDGHTPSDQFVPPMSPRVGIAAAMQADLVLQYLVGTCISKELP